MSKIVGIKIDTKSPNSKEKIYYYKTDKDLKRGEVINIKVDSGGTPKATVVIEKSNKSFKRKLDNLEIKKKRY